MNINSKETLHNVLDDMIKEYKGEPTQIGICSSYREYDDKMYWHGEYKGITISFFQEWFAKGAIAIN